MHRILPLAALAAAIAGCTGGTGGTGDDAATTAGTGADAAPAAALELETDEQRTLYALGVALGSNIGEFNLTEDELELVTMGLTDGALDQTYQVDMSVYGPQIQQLADDRASATASEERDASAAFAAEIAERPNAQVFDSGLVFVPIEEGEGESPTAEDTVNVHYHGTLRDGTVFDSSVERGEPISFPLSGVIPCWTEGVQKMRVGGKAELVCPSDIAYGDAGRPGIPGGATLLFEVELLGIE